MIWEQLGHTDRLDEKTIDIADISSFTYEKGQKIKRGPAPFPRIETDRIKALKAASEAQSAGIKKMAASSATVSAAGQPAAPVKVKEKKVEPVADPVQPDVLDNRIKIDDFMKVDLRVGKVLQAERVPKSDKLVKMQIDIGPETRQIVGGIGKAFSPEELVGRTVVVVANLKPAKLMGIESQGMVLAAGDVDTLKLAGFDAEVPPGTKGQIRIVNLLVLRFFKANVTAFAAPRCLSAILFVRKLACPCIFLRLFCSFCSVPAHAYPVYFRNGSAMEVQSHRLQGDKIYLKMQSGESGFNKDQIDMEKTLKDYNARQKLIKEGIQGLRRRRPPGRVKAVPIAYCHGRKRRPGPVPARERTDGAEEI